MMTSHRCAASVLRTKPGACGYQAYVSPFPSLSASSSATLFSKPSPFSVENGRLCGSAQTLSALGSISSSDDWGRSKTCANEGPVTSVPANAQPAHTASCIAQSPTASIATTADRFLTISLNHRNWSCRPGTRERSARLPETAVLGLGDRCGLVFMFLWPSARNGVIGTSPEIDKDVVEVTHDVRIGAERRHHALLRRVHVLAPVHHHVGEVGEVDRLQRIAQGGGVGRSFAVGAVAHMAIGVIAAKAGIG